MDPSGTICRQNYILAKISRPEVAKQFMFPPPVAMLDQLVQQKKLTHEEAHLAKHLPIAEDITVEADSGGHTDNRPFGFISHYPSIGGTINGALSLSHAITNRRSWWLRHSCSDRLCLFTRCGVCVDWFHQSIGF